MKVCLIFRHPNSLFFSIEKVFAAVIPYFKKKIELRQVTMPLQTTGVRAVYKNIRFLRQQQPANIYHVSGDVHYAVLGLPADRTILTIHDCVFLNRPAGLRKTFLKWLLLDMPVKRAAIVTAISENTRRDILRFSNCDPEKVIVIPNPISEHIFFSVKAFNQTCPLILFIGTTPNKNLERVAEALQHISCRLRIIGKPAAEQMELLDKLAIDYTAVSGLTDIAIAEEYAACDIVLFPSSFEGFGLPVIEGQKAGRIVITSDISPMKEVAGYGALLVNPLDTNSIKNAVIQAIEQATVRDNCINRGFENVLLYDAELIAGKYQDLYDQLYIKTLSGKTIN